MIHNYLNSLCSTLETDFAPPGVERFEEHFSEGLFTSPEPIVESIIAFGYETRKLRTEFFYKLPALFCDSETRLTTEREDWQVQLGSDGFFRIRMVESGTVWVSFFHMYPQTQGKGRGRFWFPRVVQLLFLAGAKRLVGVPNAHTRYPSNVPLTTERLSKFYQSYGFTEFRSEWLELDRETFMRLRDESARYRGID